jgi:hypothetical protein
MQRAHIVIGCIAFFIGGCDKELGNTNICANRCPDNAPWRVESLDLGLPCFSSKEACEQWSREHSYYKPCVKCN